MNTNKIKQGDIYVNLTHVLMHNIKPNTRLRVETLNVPNNSVSLTSIGLSSIEDDNIYIYVTLDVLDRCFEKVNQE